MSLTIESLDQRALELKFSSSSMQEIDKTASRRLDDLLTSGNPISSAKTDLMAPYLYNRLKKSRHTEELGRALMNPSLLRAAGLRQVGILTNPTDLQGNNGGREINSYKQRISHHPGIHMFDQRRLTHLFAAGWDMYLAAGQLGCSLEEQSRAAAAGLQHDLGHAALSHVGDVILDEFTGTNHEERSIEDIDEAYRTLVNTVSHYGPYNMFGTYVSWDGIQELLSNQKGIILEEPGLGQILKLVDTNAYLQIDMREAGLDLCLKSILPVIGENIRLDGRGQLLADEVGKEAIIHLLNVRREAYGRLYTHPFSLIAEAMHTKGIRRLVQLGIIDIKDLQFGTDDLVYGALLNHSRHDLVSANLLSGFHQGMGVPGSLGQYIPVDSIALTELCENTNTIEIESRVGQNLGLPPEDFVVVMPQDPGSKTINTFNQDTQEEEVLRATDTHTFHSLQGHVIVCCRPDIAEKMAQKDHGFLFK